MDLGKLREIADKRVCSQCGEVFRTKEVDGQQVGALAQYADHSVIHQPSPAQWTEAYAKIQAGKEKKK